MHFHYLKIWIVKEKKIKTKISLSAVDGSKYLYESPAWFESFSFLLLLLLFLWLIIIISMLLKEISRDHFELSLFFPFDVRLSVVLIFHPLYFYFLLPFFLFCLLPSNLNHSTTTRKVYRFTMCFSFPLFSWLVGWLVGCFTFCNAFRRM